MTFVCVVLVYWRRATCGDCTDGGCRVELEVVASGLSFPEGPVAMADGSVLVVEVASGWMSRISPGGEVSRITRLDGGPNGLAVGPDGAAYVCNNGGRYAYANQGDLLIPSGLPASHVGGSIQRVDLASGEVTTLYDSCGGERLLAPNDLVFDAEGGFWFSDHGTEDGEGARWGALVYAKSDGSQIRRAARLRTPNGVGLSPDGSTVYVADTMAGRLWAFDITGPGQVAATGLAIMPGRVVQTLPGFQLLDSLAVEAGGRICVATIMNGGITAFTPEGGFEHYPVPDRITTNICFGGEDMQTAWITASSTGLVYRTRWPRPGLPLHFNA